MVRFTIRQLLAVMLALALLLAIAVPFGWLGAVILGVVLPVATFVGLGTLLGTQLSRVTSLALTTFAATMAVAFVQRALGDQAAPPVRRAGILPSEIVLVSIGVATIVWLLLLYLTKDRTPGDRPQGAANPAGVETSGSANTDEANIGESPDVC